MLENWQSKSNTVTSAGGAKENHCRISREKKRVFCWLSCVVWVLLRSSNNCVWWQVCMAFPMLFCLKKKYVEKRIYFLLWCWLSFFLFLSDLILLSYKVFRMRQREKKSCTTSLSSFKAKGSKRCEGKRKRISGTNVTVACASLTRPCSGIWHFHVNINNRSVLPAKGFYTGKCEQRNEMMWIIIHMKSAFGICFVGKARRTLVLWLKNQKLCIYRGNLVDI